MSGHVITDSSRIQSLLAQLANRSGFGASEVGQFVADIRQAGESALTGHGYQAMPERFRALISRVMDGKTPDVVSALLDLTLVSFIDQFDERFERAGLPESLLPYYRENIDRMLSRAESGRAWAVSLSQDVFIKDLGIVRMTLIPCASHLIFRSSGIPRGLLLRQRPLNLLRGLAFVGLRSRGFAPFMENHVHTEMLQHFTAEGRETCYRLVADLLQIWPENRGLLGLSWYYDPVVATISPHLAYLRTVPAEGGALLLPAGTGPDVVRGATSTSSRRRALYEAGQYAPRRYLMAWARRDILDRYGR